MRGTRRERLTRVSLACYWSAPSSFAFSSVPSFLASQNDNLGNENERKLVDLAEEKAVEV